MFYDMVKANMTQQSKIALVLNLDTQILKGLVLLLQGMGFEAIALDHPVEPEEMSRLSTDCPALLLLPFALPGNQPSLDLVIHLRSHFRQTVPAILLSHENGLPDNQFIDEGIIVLPDQIKPADLRRDITKLLNTEVII